MLQRANPAAHQLIILSSKEKQAIYAWPDLTMVGAFLYLMAPEPLPQASMALTTLYDSTSPSGTVPKTTCLPSSHEVTTVVMKNCEPLLWQMG